MIMEGVDQHNIKMLILDNLSALTPGIEENDSAAWGEIGQWLNQVKHCGCAVMFIHHENKKGDQRGTSAREDALDCVIKLIRTEDAAEEMGINVDVVFTKHRNVEYIPRRNFMIVSTGEDTARYVGGLDKGITQKTVDIIGLMVAGRSRREITDMLNVSSKTVTKAKKMALEEEWIIERGDQIIIPTDGFKQIQEVFHNSTEDDF